MIYFDNASTTRPSVNVLDEFNKFAQKEFFNPSALYEPSISVKARINSARKKTIDLLGGGFFDDLIFTSGATESNNFVLRSIVKKNGKLLVSAGEHASIYNTAKQLKNEGYEIDFIKINKDGLVDERDLLLKLPGTTAVSIIHVSNETGAINNISRLVNIVKGYNSEILFHSDGVQAVGKIELNLSALGVDFYTFNAHKINGLKGIGALFVKNGVKVKPLIWGGEQENSRRGGTENVAGIFAFAAAVEIAIANQTKTYGHVESLKNELLNGIKNVKHVQPLILENLSSPFINVLAVEGIKSETVLHLLEERGVYVGNGSACSSNKAENRVLKEMALEKSFHTSAIRVSLTHENTTEEINEFVSVISDVINSYKRKF